EYPLPPPSLAWCLVLVSARYGASEIHNVASVVGGIASQEAVKVKTA
ncbi:unnamed protein product, partial [Laminaria digitata]